ncbi:PTS lactose transporter subunit IIC [Virgibacillus phasianinus]|uniref:Permease IIC component n=1 Tax=Virgibacillus phasianinus TaxID=2017483 RepID=A0A220U2Q0_9BACI|nr:PTS sugar transporter subunit IIC [Virgibacillus phasianinus]ASK62409.1 PTS lactose transporter subunit IIC [Virgibacillus phasianinus]
MNRFIEFMEKYFVPFASKVGSQRHLVAIRDGFVTIMPLMILGSMAILINNLPIGPYQDFMTNLFGSDIWKNFGGNLWEGTFQVISLLTAFTIAYQLANSYNKDALSAGIVSVASLIILMEPISEGAGLPIIWAGAQGLFIAIITALLSTEIFIRLLGNKRLVIKMPEGVPPAVAKSFSSLFPSMITLSIFSLFEVLTLAVDIPDIHQAFYELIQAPISHLSNTLFAAVLIAFLLHLLWFFGLHGSNMMEPIMQAVYLPAIEANAAAYKAGEAIPYVVTKPFFDAFMYLGGTGATLALITAVFIAGRRHKHYYSISKMSVAPGLFNINEPILFGFPVVLNPILFIPFLLTPVVLTVISYTAISIGLVPKTIAFIPWTTPPVIGGFLATGSWKGAALAIFNFAVAVVMYLPFIGIAVRMQFEKNK